MEQITKWKAFDGAEFLTQTECVRHELEHAHERLVGLDLPQILAAMRVFDPEAKGITAADRWTAAALEEVGVKLARERRSSGDLKRKRGSKHVTIMYGEEVQTEARTVVEALDNGATLIVGYAGQQDHPLVETFVSTEVDPNMQAYDNFRASLPVDTEAETA